MKAFQASIAIHAPAERIWALLTNAAEYPSWNPTVTKVEGRIAEGETIKVHVKINPGRAFPARVKTFVPNEKMVWSGGMPLGLFKGERVYTLTKKGTEVEFLMREEFTGLLAPLIGKSIPDLQPAFDEFARALKTAAEAGKG